MRIFAKIEQDCQILIYTNKGNKGEKSNKLDQR